MSPEAVLFLLHVLEFFSLLLGDSISILNKLVLSHLLQDPSVVFQKPINARFEEVGMFFGLHSEPEPKRCRTRPASTGDVISQLFFRPQDVEEWLVHHLREKIQSWSNLFVRNIPYVAVVGQGRVWFLFIGYRLCIDKIAIWKA